MAYIEVQSFFYDLIHCKEKILTVFSEWDDQFGDDERGALVAGIRDCKDDKLINLLINIQRMAAGYEQIKTLIDEAEQAELEDSLDDDDDDDDEDED